MSQWNPRRRFTMRSLSRGELLLMLLLLLANRLATAGQAEVEELMEKMENDVRELRDEVERIYQEKRCLSETRNQCYSNNYDDCRSRYPNPSCPGGDENNVAACGDGITCAGILDFTVSSVSLPDSVSTDNDGNPTAKQVIETVCWTRLLDEWFLRKHAADKTFWEGYGVTSPHMYFGAPDGTFRMLPARHSIHCGYFDPRKRPWYIAASSGPKNLGLILDTSESMRGYPLTLLKEAASTIVQTLTDADRVSIVHYSTEASLISPNNDGLLNYATPENKEKLIAAIQEFEASGKNNFFEAFDRAFDSFEATIDTHDTDCNSALLFFTDGEMSDPAETGHNETDILRMIKARKASVEGRIGHPMTIFTYSLGNDAVHTMPKRIACETGGLWTKIDDVRSLPERMSSYYKLFALGLGDNRNANFTAWVTPYPYASIGILGTSVAVPVYDRSVQPALLIGVAAFDFILTAIEKALGGGAGAVEAVNEVVRRSDAACPLLNLTPCELESLRRQAGGVDAMCTDACSASDLSRTEPEECLESLYILETLWDNTNYREESYENRVCCPVDGESQCPAEDNFSYPLSSKEKIIIIFSSVMGLAVVLCIVAAVFSRERLIDYWEICHAQTVHGIVNDKNRMESDTCHKTSEITAASLEELVIAVPHNTAKQ